MRIDEMNSVLVTGISTRNSEYFSPQNLEEPQAAEEEASEEDEEEEDDDDEEEEDEDDEEEDDITSAESDDSEEEVDVQLPRIQRQSKRGQNWNKTTISY